LCGPSARVFGTRGRRTGLLACPFGAVTCSSIYDLCKSTKDQEVNFDSLFLTSVRPSPSAIPGSRDSGRPKARVPAGSGRAHGVTVTGDSATSVLENRLPAVLERLLRPLRQGRPRIADRITHRRAATGRRQDQRAAFLLHARFVALMPLALAMLRAAVTRARRLDAHHG